MGKQVTYNDYLKFNYYAGQSLIENNKIVLTPDDIDYFIKKHKSIKYQTFVKRTFKNIYYTDKENLWIDRFLTNWHVFSGDYSRKVCQYKKALAFTAFSQSALKKRPFNLFHRANLYLRLNDVERGFGNKTSWDGSFDAYFKHFCNELNSFVFNDKKKHTSLNLRASELSNDKEYDLVYIDPLILEKKLAVQMLIISSFIISWKVPVTLILGQIELIMI